MQIVVNNTQITYTDTGDKRLPVIVFIHGWNDSAKTFAPLIEKLSKNYRCIALDLPNFGASQQTEDVITVADYAVVVEAFIKKLNVKNYYLIGHSMGGQIAIHGVGSDVLQPQKLILIAASGLSSKQLVAKVVLKHATKLPRRLFPKNLQDKLYKKAGSDYQTNLSPVHKKIIRSVLRDSVQAVAQKIKLPTLLIYGEVDRHTPVAIGQRFHELIRGSKLVIIDGQDHWLHQKATSEISAKIEELGSSKE